MRFRLNLLAHVFLLHNSFLSSQHLDNASAWINIYIMYPYHCNSCITKPLLNQVNFESHSQINLDLAKVLQLMFHKNK